MRDHFTIIPDLVDELDLDTYAYRLYGHIRRVTGERGGVCWQSTATLASKCQMSAGKVSEAKRILVACGLIRIRKRSAPGGKRDHITVVDIWTRNRAHFAAKAPPAPETRSGEAQPARRSSSRVAMNAMRSSGETKQIPNNQIQLEEREKREKTEKTEPEKRSENHKRGSGSIGASDCGPAGQVPDQPDPGTASDTEARDASDAAAEGWEAAMAALPLMTDVSTWWQLFSWTRCIACRDDGRTWVVQVETPRVLEALSTVRCRKLVARALAYVGAAGVSIEYVVRGAP